MGQINYYFNLYDEDGERIPASEVVAVVLKRSSDDVIVPSSFITDNYKIGVTVSDAINEICDIYINGVKRGSKIQFLGSGAIDGMMPAFSTVTIGNVVVTNEEYAEDSGVALTDLVTEVDLESHIDSAMPHENLNGTNSGSFCIDSDAVESANLVNDAGELKLRNKTNDEYRDLRVRNLYVEGTQVIIHSEEIKVDDNIITVNSNVTTTPTEDGGLEVERGTSDNAQVLWNETTDEWECGIVGAMNRILIEGDIGSDVSAGISGRSSLGTPTPTMKIPVNDDLFITRADLLQGVVAPTGTTAYAGQVLADLTDPSGGVLSEKVDQVTITVDETAHKLTLKRPKINGVSTASGYYKIAETAADPANFYAVLRITVYGTSNATIRHELFVRINGYGITVPSYDIMSSCLTTPRWV